MKFILIGALLKNGFFGLVLCILVVSIVGLFYYLRLIKNVIYDLNSPYVIRMSTVRSLLGMDLHGFIDFVVIGISYWLIFGLSENISTFNLSFVVIFIGDC